jgi:hypothetical protein
MMKRLKAVLVSLCLLAAPVLITAPALAWSPFQSVDCKGAAASSAVCQDKSKKGNPLTGANGLFIKIANVIAIVAGVAAVIIIILAGLQMVTSGGSSEDIVNARRTLIYAVVGLIVIALARTIIGYVLGRI